MPDILTIAEKAKAIRDYCDSDDVRTLCDKLEIIHDSRDLGSAAHGLKGCCMSFFGQYYLCVNSRLPSYLRHCTALHEMGHIILHADALRQSSVIQDRELFRQTVTRENEANLFAAELAISDEAMFELIGRRYTVQQAASALCVPQELILLKTEILRAYGHTLHRLEHPDAMFFGNDLTGTENF